MIELKMGRTFDLLPPNFKGDKSIQAACYAIDRLEGRLLERIRKTQTWSYIQGVPEDVADYLAAELRTPFYNADLDLETKRIMVAQTLLWYAHLGTKDVIEDIIRLVLGAGEVTEWFLYGGEPYHFRIALNAFMDGQGFFDFMEIINRVKNTRSWLESLTTSVHGESNLSIGTQVKSMYGFTGLGVNQLPIEIKRPVQINTHIRSGYSFTVIGRKMEKPLRLKQSPRLTTQICSAYTYISHPG